MFNIELSTKAQDFLNKLDNNIKDRIEERLKKLKENPVPSDAKFIGREDDEKIFRYRIGDYRVLYTISYSTSIVLIIKIDKRSKVYN